MGNFVLSPARPSDVLTYILDSCCHPTTLVVCATRENFIESFFDEASDDGSASDEAALHTRREKHDAIIQPHHSLLEAAVSRHIRVAFVPTVVHLRAFLAAFDPSSSCVGPPDASDSKGTAMDGIAPSREPRRKSLVVYGFGRLHRGSSEWSSQGLAASAVVLVEAAWRTGLDAVIVDTKLPARPVDGDRQRQAGSDAQAGASAAAAAVTSHLDERVPVLSTVPRRQLQQAGYPLRTEKVQTVLGRWFRSVLGPWDRADPVQETQEETQAQHSMAQNPGPRNRSPSLQPPIEKSAPARDYVQDSEDDESSLNDEACADVESYS